MGVYTFLYIAYHLHLGGVHTSLSKTVYGSYVL